MSARTTFVTALMGALLLAMSPFAAAASEDAGTRSAFASGAGVRAQSMAGAFGAIADDASASVWNPAGLSQLQRNELLASYATLYGLGFSEQYAFLALPSWRHGTVGIAFRHLGVDGIEQRDASNIVIAEDLSRSHWELGISYGYQLDDAWSLGLTGKLQSLSIAGYSGSGLGIDLGILGRPLQAFGVGGRWSDRVRLGLAVRNLLEPAITLDQDSVPDPTGVRLGTSVYLPINGLRSVLVGIDLEKTQDMDARVHTGLEVRLHPQFSVSAGFSRGIFTAGTTLGAKGMAVQYTFEKNDFDSIQRIGVLLDFGSTTTERKQSALDAEEDALRARMDEEFQQRQDERVKELLDQARQAQAQGLLEESLEFLDTTDALEPGRSDVKTLRVATQRQLGQRLEREDELVEAAMHYARALELDPQDAPSREGSKRCRDELERRTARSEELRAQFQAALDAFVADDLLRARDGFARIVAAQPSDTDAQAMLERTQERIDRRVAQWIEQADQYTRVQRFEAAEQLLAQATHLDPQAPQLARARANLERERSAALAAAAESAANQPDDSTTATTGAPFTAAAPLGRSADEEKEIEELYARGLTAMEEGRADDALGYWELVWSKDPDYQRVSSHLKQEYLMRGMQLFANRQLEDAIDVWENALRVDPDDDRTMSYLNRARMQLDRAEEIRGQGR